MKILKHSTATNMILSLLVLRLVTSCAGTIGGTPPVFQEDWTRGELELVVQNWRQASSVPGVVVGISLPDHSEVLISSGESDVEGRVAMTAVDQFQIASITKTFIAAKVLQLAAEGKLELEDSVSLHLPETPHGDVISIRHLLSHRSGYFDPIHDDPGFVPHLAENLERQWSWDEMLAITFQHDLFFPPGTGYSYSNANFMLLAKIIEEITGQPLGQVLTSGLVAPLHLDHTFYRTLETDVSQTGLVHGYATHPVTGQVVDTMDLLNTAILSVSTDTLVSNASDLLKWARALYGNESTVLEPAFKAQMLTFDDISSYGLGVFKFSTPLGNSFGHGGETAGYLSRMEYIPTQDLAIVILVNSDAGSINPSELRDSVLTTLFHVDLGEGVQGLIADLKSEDASIRKEAIIALGHGGTKSEEIVLSLIMVLKEDQSAENRGEAALALGFVGTDSEQARQALHEALLDDDNAVREAAQVALSALE